MKSIESDPIDFLQHITTYLYMTGSILVSGLEL